MSQRRVGYEGRHPHVVDEGPASASASDPMAMYGRLSVPGLAPTGGAGPVERRQITEAERAVRAESRPSPIAPRPRPVVIEEEPAVSEPARIATSEVPEPLPFDGDVLAILADAVLEATDARDDLTKAAARWAEARVALDAAYRALDAPPAERVDTFRSAVRPSADGGRATADELQASRKRGQAAMQAQRRAVELTSAAAAKVLRSRSKGTTGQTRTPEQRERMRQGHLASIERRKAAAAS